MTIAVSEIQATTAEVSALATAAKSLNALAGQSLDYNSALSIDWNNLPEGSVDGDGNILGTTFAPADVSNVVGSLATFQTDWWDAGHGGNCEKLSKPIV